MIVYQKYGIEQTTKDLRIGELQKLLMLHIENSDNKFSEHDETINQIVNALNNLLEKPKETRRIGFYMD